jgi:hypothetical protein
MYAPLGISPNYLCRRNFGSSAVMLGRRGDWHAKHWQTLKLFSSLQWWPMANLTLASCILSGGSLGDLMASGALPMERRRLLALSWCAPWRGRLG